MDDTQIGERDRRGDWAPKARIAYPPVLTWPAKPVAALRWIFGWPGYFMPWNMLYFLVALVVWVYLSPPMQAMADLEPLQVQCPLAVARQRAVPVPQPDARQPDMDLCQRHPDLDRVRGADALDRCERLCAAGDLR